MSMQARAMKAAGCKSTGAGRHVTSAMRWAGDRWIVLITAGAFSVELTLDEFVALPVTQYVLQDLTHPASPSAAASGPASPAPGARPPQPPAR